MAAVSETGLVTAVAVGEVEMSASYQDSSGRSNIVVTTGLRVSRGMRLVTVFDSTRNDMKVIGTSAFLLWQADAASLQ